MSTDPYVPDETELANCYAHVLEDRAGEDYATAKADERGIAAIRADALREAESALRLMADDSPYVATTQQVADGWGYACGDIDHGYADWLRERADRIEAEA